MMLISKTAYLKFEQCSKAFYLYKKHYYLRDKVELDKQLTFNRGHQIGYLAQQLFPNGRDVSKETANSTQAAALTKELVDAKTEVIYEATFIFNNILVMVDLLVRHNDFYTAYEVKNSLKISEVFLKDACLQYYVLKNQINLFDFYLVTINGNYLFNVELEIKELFKKRSIKKEAEKNIEYFEIKVAQAIQVLDENRIPNVEIGEHCFKPYQCDFFETCWKEKLGRDSVFNLPNLSKSEAISYYASGIKSIKDLPGDLMLSKNALIIKNAFINEKVHVEVEKLKQLLSELQEPYCAFDIEVLSSSIPIIVKTKPFEQIPFLFSAFDGDSSFNYFTNHETDHRESFLELLLEHTNKYATLLVFDKTLEENVINKFIELFPSRQKELLELKLKLFDVYAIFSNLLYYDSQFGNNFNLKTVSGVLLKKNFYDDIQSGLQAMTIYEMCRTSTNTIDAELNKQSLINYCLADAKATYEIVRFLLQFTKDEI
ncbi:MAG: DUF2779 domain-containing protein [Bacteroidota bacterium]